MSKRKNNGAEHDDGTYVVKTSGKSNILAFIVCVLIAVVIWASAEADQKQKAKELAEMVDAVETQTEAVTDADNE